MSETTEERSSSWAAADMADKEERRGPIADGGEAGNEWCGVAVTVEEQSGVKF